MVVESEEEEEKVRLLSESAANTPVRVIIIVVIVMIIIIDIIIIIIIVITIITITITIIIIIIAMQQLRRGSAAVVRPSEENVASSSQLPRAGWQVVGIYKIFFNIKNIVNMLMNFPGRLLCPVPPTAPRRKNFPRDEWSSLEEWAQAVL